MDNYAEQVEGNRLLYLCVIVFGIPLAYLVNREGDGGQGTGICPRL